MKKYLVALFYLGLTLAAIIGMALAGCSGGGGPITKGGTSGTNTPPVTAAFMALLPKSQVGATYVGSAKCAACHTTESTNVSHTMHAQNNVGCENCHGPGSAHVANPGSGTIAAMDPNTTNAILTWPTATNPTSDISSATVCAQCHGPLATDWAGSPHAQIVADPVQSGSNNCLRCHSAELRDQFIETPLAAGQTPVQVDMKITSLSATVLGTGPSGFGATTTASASCVDCHNPHAVTGNLDSTGTEFQLRRATSNTTPPTANDIGAGATVVTYSTYNQVCGTCHNSRGGDASDAGLARETSRVNVHEGPEMNMLLGNAGAVGGAVGEIATTSSHLNVPDQCIHCHMPDSATYGHSHTFTVQLDTSCVPCHTAADAAARESSVQGTVLSDLLALQTDMQMWATGKGYDPDQWDYTGNWAVGETAPAGYSVPIQISRARHNYAFIINDRSYGIHNWVYTETLLTLSLTQVNALLVSEGLVPVTPSVTAGSNVSKSQVAKLKAEIAPAVAKETASAASNFHNGE